MSRLNVVGRCADKVVVNRDQQGSKRRARARLEGALGEELVPDDRDFRLPDGRRLLINYSAPTQRGNGVATFFLGLPQRMSPGDVSLLVLGDAEFVMPSEVLLQYKHLYRCSADGRPTPFFQLRDGKYWIRLAEVDRWVSLEPYRNAYDSVKPSARMEAPELIGVDFVEADEALGVAPRDPFATDPDVVDRGTRGHAQTLNALARHLASLDLEPRLPGAGDPLFDLGWTSKDLVWVAEVKSLTSLNEERQLRLGLGQVLRYRFAMSVRTQRSVKAALVVERKPSDGSWIELCGSLNVALVWAPDFL
jgi:hypothetical protein